MIENQKETPQEKPKKNTRVFRAAGKGAADELAPSHSVYAYPKNPPQINVAWIPAAEAAVD